MLSIRSTVQQISRTFHVKFFAHWLAILCFSVPAAPDNHDPILCFSEFDYRIYLIYVYSYSIYPYEIGLFYIISSRFIHNLFSEGLRVQLFQSLLEVSIIAGMGLLFVSFVCFFFHFSLTDNCNLFYENPKGHCDSSPWHTVSNLHNSICSHITAWQWAASPRGLEKAIQTLEWVSLSHSIGYDCLHCRGTESGLYGSTCRKLPVSVCSASSVSRTRHRGILPSARVCTHTHLTVGYPVLYGICTPTTSVANVPYHVVHFKTMVYFYSCLNVTDKKCKSAKGEI